MSPDLEPDVREDQRECPACRALGAREDDDVVYGDARLRCCQLCGSEFLWPQPSDARLAEIYSDAYYEPWHNERPEKLKRMKELTFGPLIERVRERDAGSVLDLGCATGELLAAMADGRTELFGVDLNERAITKARARLPLASLHVGTLADRPFAGRSFDAVTMVDFIEHVRDPRAELTLVADRLTDDGIVLMSTPRVDSMVRRVSGHAWPQYREEHLTYFTRDGITTLLLACGLEPVEITPTRKAVTPAYIYGQAVAYPVPLVTPIVKAVYRALPLDRLGPQRLWFGEMTVVARRRRASPRSAPDPT